MSAGAVAADWRVQLPDTRARPSSGRVLLLLEPFTGREKARLSVNAVYPGVVSGAAQEVRDVAPGSSVLIDTDATVFPAAFSALPGGEYLAQAYLDKDRLYNLDQGGPGDLYSAVVHVTLPLEQDVVLALDHEVPALGLWDFPNAPAQAAALRAAVRPRLEEVTQRSARLSNFARARRTLRAWVLLPKDYDPAADRTWPTVYMLGTFGATHKGNIDVAGVMNLFDVSNEPSMIWVFPDFWTPQGPSLFADSEHSGPWGTALVEELIPALERRFKMDARPTGRLLTGHSTGGWSAVWLLTHYATTFGGAWATSPDPLDFTTFLKTDLYAPRANLYVDAAGQAKGIARNKTGIVTTVRDSVRAEEVLGPQGGVFQSWDSVFSPLDATGRPRPLFDRRTGAVDAAVAAYWHDHYDVAVYLREHWAALQPALDGKLHVLVGTDDDHYLDDSVHKLQDLMRELGAKASFEFLEGKTHNDLFSAGDDPVALFRRLAREMYATARASE
jgi:S-formylglutathione hydrolase FrmB